MRVKENTRIVEINQLPNGAHRNQICFFEINLPDGYAIVPDEMETKNFPFGEIEVENVNGVPTVTKWIPGVIPEPPKPEPTEQDDVDAMLVDHEYRLTLLELGVIE